MSPFRKASPHDGADVLIVEPDEAVASTLRAACRSVGLLAELVRDGAEALTSIDWHPPRAILCSGHLPDMNGWELCTVVRSDPKTAGVLFVLLAESHELHTRDIVRCGASLVLSRAVPAPAVVALTRGLIVRPVAGGAPAAKATARDRKTMSGSLSVMNLSDLVQLIAGGRRPGTLEIRFGDTTGMLHFEDGRIVDAEFAGQQGEPAVADVVARSETSGEGSFVFVPERRSGVRTTIRKNVDQLLLDIATEVDTRRAQLTGDGSPPLPGY